MPCNARPSVERTDWNTPPFPPSLSSRDATGSTEGGVGRLASIGTFARTRFPFEPGTVALSNPKRTSIDGWDEGRCFDGTDGDGVGSAQKKAAYAPIRSHTESNVVLDDAEKGKDGRAAAGGGTGGPAAAADAKLASLGREKAVASRGDGRPAV
eukprot:scaffold868_cov351-Pavlova_lutheri.AAC.10